MGQRISVDEAVQQFGVSRRTIWRLRAHGLLQLYRAFGTRKTLVDVAELERALRVRPNPAGGRPPKQEKRRPQAS